MSKLSQEIHFAREYAVDLRDPEEMQVACADDDERRVREYAKHYGVPDRDVTHPKSMAEARTVPSYVRGSRGRAEVVSWRVKAGKRDVFSSEKRSACDQFVRDHGGKIDGVKLRVVPPNRGGRR